MITPEQVKKVEQFRQTALQLSSEFNEDEYLLATISGVVRRLDDRLPKIRQRSEQKNLKQETRERLKQEREAGKKKRKASTSQPNPRPRSA